jgi:hygromycin-B 7''-O-kinase
LFTAVDLWAPYAREVCRRNGLFSHAQVRLGVPGTCPVFLVEDRWVVKFFGRMFDGGRSFEVEREAARLVQSNPEIAAARVAASGYLGLPGGEDWPWPYLVFDLIQGVSIGEVMEQVSLESKLQMAREMGSLVRALHSLPLEDQDVFPDRWDAFLDFLVEQRHGCIDCHRGWGTLPDRLIDQIEDFLPPQDDLLVDFSRPPHLIHADLTRDHLLGRVEQDRWVSLGLIDFGDAMTGSLWYELAALHLDLFGADRRLLSAFLESCPLPAIQPGWSFPQLAMAGALLHKFNVLAGLPPERFAVESLEELALQLWDPTLI